MLVAVPTTAAIALAFAVSAAVAASGNVTCSGTQTTNVKGNLTVASGTCTVKSSVTVGGNIVVDKGATLIDQGATVQGSINATTPAGIGIGGSSSGPGFVGQNISISGTTGPGPGTVDVGSNYICNTDVEQTATVTATASGAGDWIIGNTKKDCSMGPDMIAQSLYVTNNKVHVDVSDNEFGTFPYMVGIGQFLQVTGNTGTPAPVVSNNFVGQSGTCQAGTTGSGNTFEQSNNGCPA